MRGLRVIFFGMEGLFSRAPLAALLAAGCDLRAVVVPRVAHGMEGEPPLRRLEPPSHRPGALAVLPGPGEQTIVGMAWAAGVPVFEAGSVRESRTIAALSEMRPDLFGVACFPWLLPQRLLRLPRYGALNVHPSLLPAYRGPEPLFWIFHDGLEHGGVTVHLMDAGADTGDIVAQKAIALSDGISYRQAERLCSEAGGRLLAESVQALYGSGTLEGRPQPSMGVCSAPTPGEGDFVITPEWPARRAFNFICGMAEWNHPITLQVHGATFAIDEAIRFADQEPSQPVARHGDMLIVRCSPGTLTIRSSWRA